MVHKNIKYGNAENVTVVEFGNGTLAIVDAEGDSHLSLLIKTKQFSPVGAISGSEKNSDEFNPEIAIVFNNKEGFNVFSEFVENIKLKYLSENTKQQ
jgi:hypothetical protein